MSGLKSNHASAVRFSPYKVKLRSAGNDEIKFKTVLQDQRNESDRACARAMFCWPVSCDEFFFYYGIYQLLCWRPTLCREQEKRSKVLHWYAQCDTLKRIYFHLSSNCPCCFHKQFFMNRERIWKVEQADVLPKISLDQVLNQAIKRQTFSEWNVLDSSHRTKGSRKIWGYIWVFDGFWPQHTQRRYVMSKECLIYQTPQLVKPS